MSGFVCPRCHGESDIFIPSTGGADRLCKEENLRLLGKIPLDPRIGKACDMGQSYMDQYPDSKATEAYLNIVECKLCLGPCRDISLIMLHYSLTRGRWRHIVDSIIQVTDVKYM